MSILLLHAEQLLTLRGGSGPRRGAAMRDLGIIEDGAVLLSHGEISAVGKTDEFTKRESFAPRRDNPEEVDCRGKIVMPGFVDSHTHPVFAAPRLIDFEKRIAGASYEQIAAAGGGIRASIRGVRESSTETLAATVLQRFREMGAYGTTTIEAKSGYGLSFDAEIRSLEAIGEAARQWDGTVVPTFLGAHVVPPEYVDDPEEYVRIVSEDMIPAVARRRLAEFVDAFCDSGAFTMEQCQRILRSAVEQRLGVRAHVCQLTTAKLEPLMQLHPASLDHMDFTSDEDVAILARNDTVATLLPAANYFLGLPTFPSARRLIDAGVAVALATDYNPGTAPTPSMPFVLSVACTHMKMLPAEAITAATYNGAYALRLESRKGSLEVGNDADIAIFDMGDYRELAYWFGVNRCSETILNGFRRTIT